MLIASPACAPLLQTDFDGLSGPIENRIVKLTGNPTGDRMIFLNRGLFSDFDTPNNIKLSIFRDIFVGDPVENGEVYFNPISAEPNGPIFFSWSGDLVPNQAPSADQVVAGIKLKDTVNGGDQIILFPKLTIRFGSQKITAQNSGGNEFSIGGSVIDPDNIGASLTFADEINAAVSIYKVDDFLFSQREN